MPCLLAVLALAVPRVTVALLWFFTAWFDAVFATLLWPVLGFVFMPTTLLWFSAVHHWFGGEWTIGPVIGLVIALMLDFSPASGGRTRRPR